jgi:hypothetical protein
MVTEPTFRPLWLMLGGSCGLKTTVGDNDAIAAEDDLSLRCEPNTCVRGTTGSSSSGSYGPERTAARRCGNSEAEAIRADEPRSGAPHDAGDTAALPRSGNPDITSCARPSLYGPAGTRRAAWFPRTSSIASPPCGGSVPPASHPALGRARRVGQRVRALCATRERQGPDS